LLCLDGAVFARSGRGTRTIRAGDFFHGPLMTALVADELVTETRWTLPAAHAGWGFREMARRHGDFALVGVAVVLSVARKVVADVRIAIFGAAATPVRAGAAERALKGQAATDNVLAEAARLATADLETVTDIHAPAAYRTSVARTLTARALADAVARAKDAA
jgi:carbon-monoxide dehydrogenase medium subunit